METPGWVFWKPGDRAETGCDEQTLGLDSLHALSGSQRLQKRGWQGRTKLKVGSAWHQNSASSFHDLELDGSGSGLRIAMAGKHPLSMSTHSQDQASLSYEEPSIVTILIQSSFLLLLNLLNWAIDKVLYCGLIGQILVGVAWGTPGGHILSIDAEHTVVQLGYLGLILLVFEGSPACPYPCISAICVLSR